MKILLINKISGQIFDAGLQTANSLHDLRDQGSTSLPALTKMMYTCKYRVSPTASL